MNLRNLAATRELPAADRLGRIFLGALGALALCAALVARAEAKAAPDSFADLADQISPAVVNITTSTVIAAPLDGNPMVPPGSPFEDFFNQQSPDGQPEEQRSEALGSGFLISADGYIVTNNHVIDGADEIQVELFSGKQLEAKLVGTDKNTDIALLKVESPDPLPFVPMGDSDKMRVGDWVLAMGNPLGQGFSISAGIISARSRSLQGAFDDFFQTDAAINKGNSGGPLFNMDGEVIGVNTAILSPNGGSIGIGFSMASNVVSKVVGQLKEFGETRRGWLGVKIQDVTPDVAEAMGLGKDVTGVLVTDVPEGPAKAAGVQTGDVITSFDGQPVKDVRALVRQVAETEVGKAIDLVIQRDGGSKTLSITLGRREDAEAAASPQPAQEDQAPKEKTLLGLRLMVLNDEMRGQMGLAPDAQGLVITDVDPSSEAAAKGLMAGDIVTEAGQKKVAAITDLEARIQEAKDGGRKSVLLLIRRQGDPQFVALSVE